MKVTTAMLSEVSKMNYDIKDPRLLNKISKIKNAVKRKFNNKSRLNYIEITKTKIDFIFNYHEVSLLVDKYHK